MTKNRLFKIQYLHFYIRTNSGDLRYAGKIDSIILIKEKELRFFIGRKRIYSNSRSNFYHTQNRYSYYYQIDYNHGVDIKFVEVKGDF
jgi:hypothetical protein